MTRIEVAALGFPRIGPRRELKQALESFWSGQINEGTLREQAAGLRAAAWARMHSVGTTVLPTSDFSLYDHILDATAMIGAVPARFHGEVPLDSLATYFAMARGSVAPTGQPIPPMEMTKWFDTNYHFIVPELEREQRFAFTSSSILEDFEEANDLGFKGRPVIVGPITYLMLSKGADVQPLSLLERLLPVYEVALERLASLGAPWVQIDEPVLALDLDADARHAFGRAYRRLADAGPKIMLTTYFGDLEDNLQIAAELPVHGLHLDLVRAPQQLDRAARLISDAVVLSLGVVDGRNVWRANLDHLHRWLRPLVRTRDIQLAPSCSLMHCPIDLSLEPRLEPAVAGELAFAVQKLEELAELARALGESSSDTLPAKKGSSFAAARTIAAAASPPGQHARKLPVNERLALQREKLKLPPLPTTTIGSFPQTSGVRKARSAWTSGTMSDADYNAFVRSEIERAIRIQEEIGLDVLVHGEFERNDMVQYFGEQLEGFLLSKHGWVQSYGSRCVRPPIIHGDVKRPRPMTVEWWRHAQSLTDRPVKAMLTGPVTILNWSFVRDDQPRSTTCEQIAAAINEEVLDLEEAGARMIQIDEAALREGLPLRRADWASYLEWAISSFRRSCAGVNDLTQIHTHMCYSEFNEFIDAIVGLDADVISIEAARSRMEVLSAFAAAGYAGDVGPGIYDIHAPAVPSEQGMVALLKSALEHVPVEHLWVNPDCGLKTRKWEEVIPALQAMVAAARSLRSTQ